MQKRSSAAQVDGWLIDDAAKERAGQPIGSGEEKFNGTTRLDKQTWQLFSTY
jgi:hypothetical protein